VREGAFGNLAHRERGRRWSEHVGYGVGLGARPRTDPPRPNDATTKARRANGSDVCERFWHVENRSRDYSWHPPFASVRLSRRSRLPRPRRLDDQASVTNSDRALAPMPDMERARQRRRRNAGLRSSSASSWFASRRTSSFHLRRGHAQRVSTVDEARPENRAGAPGSAARVADSEDPPRAPKAQNVARRRGRLRAAAQRRAAFQLGE